MLRTAVDAEMLASIDKGHGKTNLVVEQYALRRYMNTNLKALDFVIEHADIIEKDLILFLDEAIINLNIDAAKIILKRIDISRFKLNNFYTLYKEERAKNMLRFALSTGLDPNADNFSSNLSRVTLPTNTGPSSH